MIGTNVGRSLREMMLKHDDVEERQPYPKLSEDLKSLEDQPPVDLGAQRHDAAGNVIRS